ncbi:unnamed protein product [Orchesella dallaii]|uniref:RNA-binding protein 8A n=1 Tax=Orchesella dallaii TaxID=48710 RepID=A0ABP1Q6X2_9HEXA
MSDVLELGVGHPQEDEMAMVADEVGVGKLKQQARKKKGRGFVDRGPRESLDNFETLSAIDNNEPSDVQAQRSVEGWILIVTGIHEEGHEEDVLGRFAEFGEIVNIRLDLDRQTGFLKGYALIQYENFKDAVAAKNSMEGAELLGNVIHVDWAFMKKPISNSSGRSHVVP